MLAGQHRTVATNTFRENLIAEHEEVPEWCKYVNVRLTKDNLSVDRLQDIAGRLQAQSAAVIQVSMFDTFSFLHREVQARRRDRLPIDQSNILRKVYRKTGKSLVLDGPPVCCLLLDAFSADCCQMHASFYTVG